jgi:nicotinamide riboside kinase
MPKIIIITGAESTGKSSLTKQLSKYFTAPYVEEYARSYISALNRKYTYQDILSIAHMQTAQMNAAKKLNQKYVFFDTWLIITLIWFEHVFKTIPQGLTAIIEQAPVDLFLVCNTDIPWFPDPVRENGGGMRDLLQKKYLEIINQYNFNYSIVSGEDEKRLLNAIKIIHHKIG